MVSLAVNFEDHKTKSGMLEAQINKVFFFMILNTLLLPVTEASSALVLADYLEKIDITSWPAFVASNLMNQQYFYIKIIINLAFITNGVSLFDGVHLIYSWFMRWWHNRQEKSAEIKTEYIDDYDFDIGYHQSYCLVIFLNCVLFSTLVPFIPFFGSVFFYFKYMVDKNNLVFKYEKHMESGGRIKQKVQFFLMFNLGFYLLVMGSFFGFLFGGNFKWASPLLILIWTVMICCFRQRLQKNQALRKLSIVQNYEEPELD